MGSRVDEIRGISGFLVPVYSDDELPGREARHALTPADMVRIRDGLACPRCLAFWESYRPVCPVCGHERDVSEDIVRAADWEQYLAEQKRADESPRRTVAPQMHERIEQLMRGRGR